MEGSFFTRHRRALISGAIILIIALHAVPAVYPRERGTLWPILTWAMYKDSKPAGPIATDIRRVYAITAGGTRDLVNPHLTGLSVFALGTHYFRPMQEGDSLAARKLLDRLNQHRKEDPYVEIRMEAAKYTATDSGIVKQEHPAVIYRAQPSHSH